MIWSITINMAYAIYYYLWMASWRSINSRTLLSCASWLSQSSPSFPPSSFTKVRWAILHPLLLLLLWLNLPSAQRSHMSPTVFFFFFFFFFAFFPSAQSISRLHFALFHRNHVSYSPFHWPACFLRGYSASFDLAFTRLLAIAIFQWPLSSPFSRETNFTLSTWRLGYPRVYFMLQLLAIFTCPFVCVWNSGIRKCFLYLTHSLSCDCVNVFVCVCVCVCAFT